MGMTRKMDSRITFRLTNAVDRSIMKKYIAYIAPPHLRAKQLRFHITGVGEGVARLLMFVPGGGNGR